MKLEEQVCSLEQANTFKLLGIIQKSHFYWMNGILVYNEAWGSDYYSAFTVAELGVMLPEYISGKDELCLRLTQWCMDDRESFRLQYRERMGSIREHDLPNEFIDAKTEAEARAALLIYLLENNHITPAEINHRLQQ